MSFSGWAFALPGVERFSCLALRCADAELLWPPTHPATSTIDAPRRAHLSAAVCGLSSSMKTGSYNPTHETTAQARLWVLEFIAVSTTAGDRIRRACLPLLNLVANRVRRLPSPGTPSASGIPPWPGASRRGHSRSWGPGLAPDLLEAKHLQLAQLRRSLAHPRPEIAEDGRCRRQPGTSSPASAICCYLLPYHALKLMTDPRHRPCCGHDL
jgi:hypothetical protein